MCVSSSEDGSGSFDSFVAKTNAQATRLVAQRVRLDARRVLDAVLLRARTRTRCVIASRAMTGTGH